MNTRIILICFFAATMLLNPAISQETERNKALEIMEMLAPGINLFNTLDAVAPSSAGLSSETYWGQPYTTKAMITAMKDRGFKTLRIPVSWFTHAGPAPDYTIDAAWMDRVEEVANFALDNDMYVIINMHHEDLKSGRPGSWLITEYENQDAVANQLEQMWTQIATHFKDYGDHLIFETMNEPRVPGGELEWSGGTAEHRDVMNALNKASVDAIRASGGNNETRYIMLPQVGANPTSAIEDMIIPNNDTNTIVSVHAYSPYDFCLNENGTSSWGSASEIAELENLMNALSDRFVANGQAVVMGEWGATDKNNYAQRINYYSHYSRACKEAGITPIIWMFDFKRSSQIWPQPLVEDAILSYFDPNFIEVESLILNLDTDTLDLGDNLQLTAAFEPESATPYDVIWSSDNNNVATISNEGLVITKSAGSAGIRALTLGAETDFHLVVQDTFIQYSFFFEAEHYDEQRGIRTDACEDENGGWHVSYTREGYWCSYNLDVDTAGTYNFFARVATNTEGGRIEISANGKNLGECIVDGSMSDGWQDWFSTDTLKLELGEGKCELLLTFKGEGAYLFNFNWFELTFNTPQVSNINFFSATSAEDQMFRIYPNPAKENVTIVSESETALQREIIMINISGQTVLREEMKYGQNSLTLDLEGISSGLYILRVGDKNGWTTKKLMVY